MAQDPRVLLQKVRPSTSPTAIVVDLHCPFRQRKLYRVLRAVSAYSEADKTNTRTRQIYIRRQQMPSECKSKVWTPAQLELNRIRS